jgi:hypothetical protein
MEFYMLIRFFIFLFVSFSLVSSEIVHLAPPTLSDESIGLSLLCKRPARKGGFKYDIPSWKAGGARPSCSKFEFL